MENYTNDISAFALLFILFSIICSALVFLLAMSVVFFIARALMPVAASHLRISSLLTGHSKYDAAAFLVSWLFAMLVFISIIQLLFFQFYVSLHDFYKGMNSMSFYLIPFTFFRFDRELHMVSLKPFKKIFVIGLLYFALDFVFNIPGLGQFREISSYTSWIFAVIQPLVTALVTLALIRKSVIKPQAEPLKFVP